MVLPPKSKTKKQLLKSKISTKKTIDKEINKI